MSTEVEIVGFISRIYNQLRYCKKATGNQGATDHRSINLNQRCANDPYLRYNHRHSSTDILNQDAEDVNIGKSIGGRKRRLFPEIISQFPVTEADDDEWLQPVALKRRKNDTSGQKLCLGFPGVKNSAKLDGICQCNCPIGTLASINNSEMLQAAGYTQMLANDLAKLNTCVMRPCQWDTPLEYLDFNRHQEDHSIKHNVNDSLQDIPSYESANKWIVGKGCACAADRGWVGVVATTFHDTKQGTESFSNNVGVEAPMYANRCVRIAAASGATIQDWKHRTTVESSGKEMCLTQSNTEDSADTGVPSQDPMQPLQDAPQTTSPGVMADDYRQRESMFAHSESSAETHSYVPHIADNLGSNSAKGINDHTYVDHYDDDNDDDVQKGSTVNDCRIQKFVNPVLAQNHQNLSAGPQPKFYSGYMSAYQNHRDSNNGGFEFLHVYPFTASSLKFAHYLTNMYPETLDCYSQQSTEIYYIVIREPPELTLGNKSWFSRLVMSIDNHNISNSLTIAQQIASTQDDTLARNPFHMRLWRTSISKQPPGFHAKCPYPRLENCKGHFYGARTKSTCHKISDMPCMVTSSWKHNGQSDYEDVTTESPGPSPRDDMNLADLFRIPLCSNVEKNAFALEFYQRKMFSRTHYVSPSIRHPDAKHLPTVANIVLEDNIRETPLTITRKQEWYHDYNEVIRRVSSLTPICCLDKAYAGSVQHNGLLAGTLVPSPLSARTRNISGLFWEYTEPVGNSKYPGFQLTVTPLLPQLPDKLINIPLE